MSEIGTSSNVSRAFERYSIVQEQRVRTLYNRHRALFAEFVVEQLLTGSEDVEDPTSSWDLLWPVGQEMYRVQVKCSGSYLPRTRKHGTAAKWDLTPPKQGWDSISRSDLEAGHHCDLIVLARHEGDDIEQGWTFATLSLDELGGAKSHNSKSLGKPLVAPDQLEVAALEALGVSTRDRLELSSVALVAGLVAAPHEAWDRLWASVDAVVPSDLRSTWEGGRPLPGSDSVIQMPRVDYSDALKEVITALYDVRAVVDFDWMGWSGLELYPNTAALSDAPDADVIRMLTTIVRSERFSEGSLKAAVDSGMFGALLTRLRAWDMARRPDAK